MAYLSRRANPVTLDNLRRGIENTFTYIEKKGQSHKGEWEFHNDLYIQLENRRSHGITLNFWVFLVDELARWRAIRPKTKIEIFNEGKERLLRLKYCFDKLIDLKNMNLPSIESLDWDEASPLFKIASSIKGMTSPMFGSKLCHFLFPSAYFVFDNTLVKQGWKKYRNYWMDCRDAWLKSPDKNLLKQELQKNIPTIPCASYPWPTKITEICQFDLK